MWRTDYVEGVNGNRVSNYMRLAPEKKRLLEDLKEDSRSLTFYNADEENNTNR
jgi:hypothetical protein